MLPWDQAILPLLSIFALLIGTTLVLLLGSHFNTRRLKARKRQLGEQLIRIHKFPQRYQRLLRVLLSAKTYRVEALFERLAKQEIQQINRTNIPKKLRRLAEKGRKWQRVRAMLLLGLLQDSQAVSLLRQQALHNDRDLAYAAVAALGRYADESNARFLISLLSSRYTINGSRVASVLEGMRLNLAEHLLTTLELKDNKARFWAATLLGRYDQQRVRKALVQHLDDDDANVRAAAVDSLGRVGDASCATELIRALNDDVWYVRAHAALACGQTHQYQSVPTLMTLLADPFWWVRFDAAEAITMLMQGTHSKKIRDQLLEQVDAPDPFARHMITAILANNREAV